MIRFVRPESRYSGVSYRVVSDCLHDHANKRQNSNECIWKGKNSNAIVASGREEAEIGGIHITFLGRQTAQTARSHQKWQVSLRGLRRASRLRSRIPLRILTVLLTVLLVLRGASTLSLELTTPTATSTTVAATGVRVSARSTLLIL